MKKAAIELVFLSPLVLIAVVTVPFMWPLWVAMRYTESLEYNGNHDLIVGINFGGMLLTFVWCAALMTGLILAGVI